MVGRGVALLLVWAGVTACAASGGPASQTFEERLEQRLEASPEQLREIYGQGAVLLDVRPPDEFAAGHLPEAINIPIVLLYEGRLNALPRTKPIIVYSEEGMLSAGATTYLLERHYDVYDLGPMTRWREIEQAP